ncbi:lipopolysaccharide biosynthesis protein [Salimicrobium salexigens]|uniref:Membrane protein involved in the export of O-antigen and teichoic acid n=1 Tax=Salimicrobium salexigens TaxID=908941 RepID=A0ABY1L242_9BACI|nr:oligosaccharide flippase family protein [Salimicrobium salexigens]SIS89780.1 Membrane protein involved in the export of O-antigen and teichoic acid [Salimicrobium salexigens]
MENILIRISRKSFVRNVAIVASGTASAQVIMVVSSQFLTRIYGPEAFGMFGVYSSIIAIITPVAALTYPVAVVLPKSKETAMDLMRLSFYITLLVTMVTAVFLMLFSDVVVSAFNLEEVASFLYCLPLVIFFTGCLQITEQWLIRNDQFKITARSILGQTTIIQAGMVGAGLFNPLAAILILFTSMNQALRSFLMMVGAGYFKPVKVISFLTDINMREMQKLAKRYYDFPVFRSPQLLLNGFSQGFPVLMLSSFFSPVAAGYYAIGRMALDMPTNLIGKAISDVLYPRISRGANNFEKITPILLKATAMMGGIGLLPFGLVILIGPWLFELVFGEGWLMAGEYAVWIAVWGWTRFLRAPSVSTLPVLSAQGFHLGFTICSLIVRVSAMFAGYWIFGDDLIAVAWFCISGAFMNILLVLITWKRTRRFDAQQKENSC